jgi:hypothetical protein
MFGDGTIRGVERVTVRIYREGSSGKIFGSDYVRANGNRTIIATRQSTVQAAKNKATIAVHECEWEPTTLREDGFVDVGRGWIDTPESDETGPR